MPDKVILLMNFERERGKVTCWFKFLFSFQGLASLCSVSGFTEKRSLGGKERALIVCRAH